jgi:hypothetical protein
MQHGSDMVSRHSDLESVIATPEAARLAEDAGFDRLLVKPLALAALQEVLGSATSRRGRAAVKSADCGAAD